MGCRLEWLLFLKQIDRETPRELQIHLIADIPSMRRSRRGWRDTRVFTCTLHHGQFLLNLVERFFADLTGDVVREGSFGSVRELSKRLKTIWPDAI